MSKMPERIHEPDNTPDIIRGFVCSKHGIRCTTRFCNLCSNEYYVHQIEYLRSTLLLEHARKTFDLLTSAQYYVTHKGLREAIKEHLAPIEAEIKKEE